MTPTTAWGQASPAVANLWQLTSNVDARDRVLIDRPQRRSWIGSTYAAPAMILLIPGEASGDLRRYPLSAGDRETAQSSPRLVVPDRAEEDDRPPLLNEMLGTIRVAFSLTVTELAQVIRVERPTIYSWLGDRAQPQVANLRRMTSIWRLANRWLASAGRPLGDFKRLPVVDGCSVLDLLSGEPLRHHPLGQQLGRLARLRSREQPPARGQGGRDAAALLGLDGPVPGAEDRISFETGQRTGPE